MIKVVNPAPANTLLVTSSKPKIPKDITNKITVNTNEIILKMKSATNGSFAFETTIFFAYLLFLKSKHNPNYI